MFPLCFSHTGDNKKKNGAMMGKIKSIKSCSIQFELHIPGLASFQIKSGSAQIKNENDKFDPPA